MADFIIEIFLSIPGAAVFKTVTRSKKSIKTLILEDTYVMPVIGTAVLIIVCFLGSLIF